MWETCVIDMTKVCCCPFLCLECSQRIWTNDVACALKVSAIISNDHYHQPLRMSNELSQHRQCTAKELGWKTDSIIKSQDRTEKIIILLRGHSKTDKIKILMTNGSLMKVESIAEGAFCNTFEMH